MRRPLWLPCCRLSSPRRADPVATAPAPKHVDEEEASPSVPGAARAPRHGDDRTGRRCCSTGPPRSIAVTRMKAHASIASHHARVVADRGRTSAKPTSTPRSGRLSSRAGRAWTPRSRLSAAAEGARRHRLWAPGLGAPIRAPGARNTNRPTGDFAAAARSATRRVRTDARPEQPPRGARSDSSVDLRPRPFRALAHPPPRFSASRRAAPGAGEPLPMWMRHPLERQPPPSAAPAAVGSDARRGEPRSTARWCARARRGQGVRRSAEGHIATLEHRRRARNGPVKPLEFLRAWRGRSQAQTRQRDCAAHELPGRRSFITLRAERAHDAADARGQSRTPAPRPPPMIAKTSNTLVRRGRLAPPIAT